MLTNLTCMRTPYIGKKQTLVFLIHAHFAVTTVLSNVPSDHFFQQNKVTITFNKTVTCANLIDHTYLADHQNKLHAKAIPVTRFG